MRKLGERFRIAAQSESDELARTMSFFDAGVDLACQKVDARLRTCRPARQARDLGARAPHSGRVRERAWQAAASSTIRGDSRGPWHLRQAKLTTKVRASSVMTGSRPGGGLSSSAAKTPNLSARRTQRSTVWCVTPGQPAVPMPRQALTDRAVRNAG